MQRAPSLGEDLASTLREMIARERLKDGDRLPTEKLLAEQYGVSRTVVREAIARLQTEGLVATRQGSGVFISRRGGVFRVQDFRTQDFRTQDTARKQQHFQNVYELRLGVESAAAELAALRRSDGDIDELRSRIEAMNDPEQRPLADTQFHIGVAHATGNALYESFVGFVGDELSLVIGDAVKNTIDRHPLQIERVIAEHEAVLAAIIDRNGLAARRAMVAHLAAAAKRLSLGLAENSLEPPDIRWVAGLDR